jgi:RimJ/RimL family protein N-acetyltransferase
MKGLLDDCLLGTIIWLPHTTETSSMCDEEREKELARRRKSGEIVDEEFGTAIGELHLNMLPAHKQHHRNTEIGLDILPPYQSRGYGSEAIKWALDYAFRRAGLHRVKVRAFSWNEGALRLYKKLGFVVEGRERESVWHEGQWWDVVTLGMLKGEWQKLLN